jgi:hypothetical protein
MFVSRQASSLSKTGAAYRLCGRHNTDCNQVSQGWTTDSGLCRGSVGPITAYCCRKRHA